MGKKGEGIYTGYMWEERPCDSPLPCSGQSAFSESTPVFSGRSLSLLWALWGQLKLRACLAPACTYSQSLVAPKVHNLMLSSVQLSCSVISDSLWPHEPQHARPPCPSPTPRVHPKSCPLSQWWHPAISSSVVSFSSCPQSFPASVSFQMSQLFASGGQSIGASASTSALPVNTQDYV